MTYRIKILAQNYGLIMILLILLLLLMLLLLLLWLLSSSSLSSLMKRVGYVFYLCLFVCRLDYPKIDFDKIFWRDDYGLDYILVAIWITVWISGSCVRIMIRIQEFCKGFFMKFFGGVWCGPLKNKKQHKHSMRIHELFKG